MSCYRDCLVLKYATPLFLLLDTKEILPWEALMPENVVICDSDEKETFIRKGFQEKKINLSKVRITNKYGYGIREDGALVRFNEIEEEVLALLETPVLQYSLREDEEHIAFFSGENLYVWRATSPLHSLGTFSSIPYFSFNGGYLAAYCHVSQCFTLFSQEKNYFGVWYAKLSNRPIISPSNEHFIAGNKLINIRTKEIQHDLNLHKETIKAFGRNDSEIFYLEGAQLFKYTILSKRDHKKEWICTLSEIPSEMFFYSILPSA